MTEPMLCAISNTGLSAVAADRIESVDLLLAGADVTFMASILMMKGPEFLALLLRELSAWLEEHEYDSVEQLKGSMSRGNAPDPGALERANYMKALISYSTENASPFGEAAVLNRPPHLFIPCRCQADDLAAQVMKRLMWRTVRLRARMRIDSVTVDSQQRCSVRRLRCGCRPRCLPPGSARRIVRAV